MEASTVAASRHKISPSSIILAAVIALIAAAVYRYLQAPSFWLDEAFIAVSLRYPTASNIFAQLEYGQYFPRLYLGLIALLRTVVGYEIWVLRLFPFASFVAATCLWGRLLVGQARGVLPVAVLTGSLLVGASFWLDQAIQLKQYTFEVLLALIPFLASDRFYEESFGEGKRKTSLALLALPCALSYTYPVAYGARVVGWYVYRAGRRSRRLNVAALAVAAAACVAALSVIVFTDHRFNFKDRAAYLDYWHDCILLSQLKESFADALRLLAKFLWGWHSRQSLVTVGMVPLHLLGVYGVIKAWRHAGSADEPIKTGAGSESAWGSRSLGSLVLLVGLIAASLVASYPICAGRVLLFAQIHTQILAAEGALLVLTRWGQVRWARAALYLFIAVVIFYSGRQYIRFVASDPSENLRPAIVHMKADLAGKVWVHTCSIAQARSLPEPFPVEEVLLGT
ncbi:MAG TPA: hypothetical protein VJQ56_15440, partial [Blastocatellia bacterium]|nr:hypothetical protein [Blastocatellia bacterium]